MPDLLAYALLFTGVGAFFIFSHLMIGKLVRPNRPDAEKKTIYECGEPTIGSAWVQFDLRFYVVALLFVIFDVEMAFFFPWAVVFGRANTMADARLPAETRIAMVAEMQPPEQWKKYRETVEPGEEPNDWKRFKEDVSEGRDKSQQAAREFAWIAFADILIFFAVLLVGFAYLWKRGDLDWVRSVAGQKAEVRDQMSEVIPKPETSDRVTPAGELSV